MLKNVYILYPRNNRFNLVHNNTYIILKYLLLSVLYLLHQTIFIIKYYFLVYTQYTQITVTSYYVEY